MDGRTSRKPGFQVTSAQVAERAGVSQSAVSRSFTPGASIAPATRAKVLAAARELGYRPNALARSLITSHSRIIGVVMAHLENLFYPTVLELLGQRLRQLNYHMLLFPGFDTGGADPVFDQIMQYRVDGIVLACAGLTSELAEACTAAGIPVVHFNRTTQRDAVSSVTTGNYAGGKRVADFLVAGGHQKFGYIAGIVDSSTNRDRLTGFADGLAAHGAGPPVVRIGNYSVLQAAVAARELLGHPERPDAIFVANDYMAFSVIDTIRQEFGLAIPCDVSVVGYDNAGPAGWGGYDITTVSQPAEAMVAATLEILMAQIGSGVIEPTHRVLPGELIVRGSARRPVTGLVTCDGLTLYRPEDRA